MINVVVSVKHVTMDFKGERVLDDVSHDFEERKIHGIIGNNGSGKTVLFKCICGFLAPMGGKILVDYEQVGKDMDFPEDLGLIIETPGFLPNMSGLKNLQILASLRKKIGNKEIIQAIRRVGLNPAMKKHVGKYSLGMRQRLGIAQAIMEDPNLLILDEPFNGLDKQGVADMRELLRELRAAGKTILLASHNTADIDELCDTICEMADGKLVVVRSAVAG
jgi:ABC-2 type transport system ATP-binding protein